ncbi:hypothetical protein ACFFLM_15635 [Deinococcus oregonensis]|uniref:Uncharacterized protein n=1 Tax=Deinococcus oregonensis TaxID=1805970 RepID=A0ABV6B4R5_9DEIO
MSAKPTVLQQQVCAATIALRGNLEYIAWREEHPYGNNRASAGVQLCAALLMWVAICPLEEALTWLATDIQGPRNQQRRNIPDLLLSEPESFRTRLPQWRQAIAAGQVEVVFGRDEWTVGGLRAWLTAEQGGGPLGWDMTLNRSRLDALVDALDALLPFWGVPLTLPDALASPADASPIGTKQKGRRRRRDEPKE